MLFRHATCQYQQLLLLFITSSLLWSTCTAHRHKRSLAKILMHIRYDPVRLIRVSHAQDMTKEILKTWKDIVPTILMLPITANMPDTYGITKFISPNGVAIKKASKKKPAFKYPEVPYLDPYPKDPYPWDYFYDQKKQQPAHKVYQKPQSLEIFPYVTSEQHPQTGMTVIKLKHKPHPNMILHPMKFHVYQKPHHHHPEQLQVENIQYINDSHTNTEHPQSEDLINIRKILFPKNQQDRYEEDSSSEENKLKLAWPKRYEPQEDVTSEDTNTNNDIEDNETPHSDQKPVIWTRHEIRRPSRDPNNIVETSPRNSGRQFSRGRADTNFNKHQSLGKFYAPARNTNDSTQKRVIKRRPKTSHTPSQAEQKPQGLLLVLLKKKGQA